MLITISSIWKKLMQGSQTKRKRNSLSLMSFLSFIKTSESKSLTSETSFKSKILVLLQREQWSLWKNKTIALFEKYICLQPNWSIKRGFFSKATGIRVCPKKWKSSRLRIWIFWVKNRRQTSINTLKSYKQSNKRKLR